MKHIFALFLGSNLESLAQSCKQEFLRQSADADTRDKFDSIWCPNTEADEIVFSEFRLSKSQGFNANLDDQYTSVKTGLQTFSESQQDNHLANFFQKVFLEKGNMLSNGNGNQMLLQVVVAGEDTIGVNFAERLVRILSAPSLAYDVDVVLLAPDLFHTVSVSDTETPNYLQLNKTTQQSVAHLLDTKSKHETLRHVILLSNVNEARNPLNMDTHTLARVLALYNMASIENYDLLFNTTTESANPDTITAIGLSALTMDKYYFMQYLLHHSYLYILGSEKVQQRDVDINKVAAVAQRLLGNRMNTFSDFYRENVEKELSNGKTPEQISAGIQERLNGYMEVYEKQVLSFICDEQLSLPEKRAVLAYMLLEDDELISGQLLGTEQCSFFDCLREPFNVFVQHNNAHITFETDEDGHVIIGEDGKPVILHSVLSAPRGDDGKISTQIKLLKSYRLQIRGASDFIRQKTDEATDMKKRLSDQGQISNVIVDDNSEKYQFYNAESEEPLQDDYVPVPTTVKSFDLSPNFTPIKDQGPIGSCSAFAVTSVYEYILKKNKEIVSDLSERFVYYNVRKEHGGLNSEGSAISHVIGTMTKHGVCTETLCPYSVEHYNDDPSEEAVSDAVKRTVKKALNIPLTNDLDVCVSNIRSSIAEGYPVIISLRVYPSLHRCRGPVEMPQAGETDEGSHAMVIVGYDDDAQMFKVRNSWGASFGEQGYCYIPYDYIGDHSQLNNAYIITEISLGINVKGLVGNHHVEFAQSDLRIQLAIIDNRLRRKRREQKWLQKQYENLFREFCDLELQLQDGNVRNRILNETMEGLDASISDTQQQAQMAIDELSTQLTEFDNETIRTRNLFGIIFVLLFVATIIAAYLSDFDQWWIGGGVTAALVVGVLLKMYLAGRKRRRIQLKQELDDNIQGIQRQLHTLQKTRSEMNLRFFVAGAVVNAVSKLHCKLQGHYIALVSLVNNLAVWQDEEEKNIQCMTPAERRPIIALIDNAVLDKYFKGNAQNLRGDFRLYHYFNDGQYRVGDQQIADFKEKLKQQLLQHLGKVLDGFSIYNHINGIVNYPFLKADYTVLQTLMSRSMTPFSRVFLTPENSTSTITNIFVKCDDTTMNVWKQRCAPCCQGAPNFGKISSPNQLINIQIEYLKPENITILR